MEEVDSDYGYWSVLDGWKGTRKRIPDFIRRINAPQRTLFFFDFRYHAKELAPTGTYQTILSTHIPIYLGEVGTHLSGAYLSKLGGDKLQVCMCLRHARVVRTCSPFCLLYPGRADAARPFSNRVTTTCLASTDASKKKLKN
jgi:hypothetical protein